MRKAQAMNSSNQPRGQKEQGQGEDDTERHSLQDVLGCTGCGETAFAPRRDEVFVLLVYWIVEKESPIDRVESLVEVGGMSGGINRHLHSHLLFHLDWLDVVARGMCIEAADWSCFPSET